MVRRVLGCFWVINQWCLLKILQLEGRGINVIGVLSDTKSIRY